MNRSARRSLPTIVVVGTLTAVAMAGPACEHDGNAGAGLQTDGSAVPAAPGVPSAAVRPTSSTAPPDLNTGSRVGAPDDPGSRVVDRSPDGFLTGTVTRPDGRVVAVVWDGPGAEGRELERLDYPEVVPVAVNRRHRIVGNAMKQRPEGTEVVMWEPDGSARTLARITRFRPWAKAVDMNDNSMVVGNFGPSPCCGVAGFVWTAENDVRVLSGLGSSEGDPDEHQGESQATGVNEAGEIVGWATDPATGRRRPATWDPQSLQLRIVPDLGGPSELVDVNDAGIALGHTLDDTGRPTQSFCVSLRTGRVAPVADRGGAATPAGPGVAAPPDGRPSWDATPCGS